MDYIARQKIEMAVIAALYMVPAVYSSIAFKVNLAAAMGSAVVAYVVTTGLLTLLRTDDMPDDYGSMWDYPPLLIIFAVFLGFITWLSW